MKPIPRDCGSFLATAKKYAEPYLAPDKPVWLVGLSFERGTRRFVEGAVARVEV